MSELDAVLFANEAFYRAFADRDMDAMEDLWAASGPVCCIHPGWEAIYEREPQLRTARLSRTPAGREVDPEEVADLVLFLCSDKASYINGTAIPIDGSFLNNSFILEGE